MIRANLFMLTAAIGIATFGTFYFANANDNNDTSVLKTIIPDTAITANIKSKLLAENNIKSLSIHVETINGRVNLTGVVPNDEIKYKVISIAKNTDGVNEVISDLQVKSH